MKHLKRRDFIQKGIASAFVLSTHNSFSFLNKASSADQRKFYVFSKHLQWLNYNEMADFIASCGFDGTDVTVRPKGHVEPARVEQDLPLVVEALKKAGKEVTMITTSILKADEPYAESILKTAGQLGIQYYRPGWFKYDRSISIDENLKNFEEQLRGLIKLNQQYNIKASYQNHAGTGFGSPVWDIGQLLYKIDSPWLGCQYDVRHAVVEGGTSWPLGFDYVKPYINTLDIKDFIWTKENGKWITKNVPLGEGMVDFDQYSKLVNTLPVSIPMCVHLEFPLGGAEHGDRKITMSPEEIKKTMMKELEFVRARF